MPIELRVYDGRTYFSGRERNLRKMFHCLRVKNPNAYWQARKQLQRNAYVARYRLKERGLEPEEITKELKKEREKIQARAKYVRFYDRRNDSFRTGLLPRVLDYLGRKKIRYVVVDKRRKPAKYRKPLLSKFHFKTSVEYRPEQITAVQAALKKGRGILACPMNFGKTVAAAGITSQLPTDVRVLYLVHRIGLARQVGKKFEELLPNPVAVLGAGEKEFSGRNICVATIQTAVNLTEIPTFRRFLQKADVFFVDEIHVNSAASVCKISDGCQAPMRFGLSGTVDEKNKIKMMHYQGITGPVIARTLNAELIAAGRSAKPKIKFIEVHAKHISNRANFATSYMQGIVRCEERNSLILRKTLHYVKKELPVLISVSRVKHGIILEGLLKAATDFPVAFLQGSTPLNIRDKTLNRFVHGKVAVLILSPIGDVGLDLPGGVGAWINAAASKGYELVLQRLGRALRKNKYKNTVRVVDFVDLHNPYLLEHSLARIRHFQREGFKVDFKEA